VETKILWFLSFHIYMFKKNQWNQEEIEKIDGPFEVKFKILLESQFLS